MTTYSGINNTENLLAIGERALTRRKERDREEVLRRSGGYIADGNFDSASKLLLRSGAIDDGLAVETAGKERRTASNRASTIAEALGGMVGEASVPAASAGSNFGPKAPASALLKGEYSVSNSAGITDEGIIDDVKPTAQTETAASTALATGMPTPSGGLTTKQMYEQTGGDISSGMLFSMAAKFAKDGDVEMAEKYMEAATTRKGVETELQKAEQAKQAQYIFDLYADSEPEDRKELIDQLLANPDLQKGVPNEIMLALKDRNPENDDAAVIAWTRMFGGDPTRLETKRDDASARELELADYEREKADEEAKARADADREVSVYERKLKLEAKYGKVDPEDDNAYASQYADVPNSVKTAIFNSENKIIEAASADATRADLIFSKSKEFVSILDENNLWGAMGGGMWENLQQFFNPSEINRLKGISNELVTEMKKPGAGVFTDDDAARAELTVIGINKKPESIREMMVGASKARDRAAEKEAFLSEFQMLNGIGSLREGERLWKQYTNEVPIMLFDEVDGTVVMNGDFASFEEWIAEKQAEEDRRSFEAELDGLDPNDEDALLNSWGE